MKIINGITVRIMILFVIGFFGTYIHDFLSQSDLFGDYLCTEDTHNRFPFDIHEGEYYWGARHYWYVWGCVFVLGLGVTRTIIWANEEVNKK